MTGYGLYYCMGGFSFKIFLELWDDDGSYDCYQSDAMRSTNMNYNGTDQKTNTPAWEQTYIFTKILDLINRNFLRRRYWLELTSGKNMFPETVTQLVWWWLLDGNSSNILILSIPPAIDTRVTSHVQPNIIYIFYRFNNDYDMWWHKTW